MFVVQGIYDDGTVTINEPPPVNKRYDVIVAFLKPADQTENGATREKKLSALNRITGILVNSTMTLEDARAERLSRQ